MWDYQILNKSITISISNNMYQIRLAVHRRKPRSMKLFIIWEWRTTITYRMAVLIVTYWLERHNSRSHRFKATYRSVKASWFHIYTTTQTIPKRNKHEHRIAPFHYVNNGSGSVINRLGRHLRHSVKFCASFATSHQILQYQLL